MSDKKYRIKKGERIKIEIARKQTQNSKLKTQNLPKGIVKVRRDEGYLARRLNRQKYISFYDLGLVISGASYVDIEHQDIQEWTLPVSGGISAATGPDGASFAARDSLLAGNLVTAAKFDADYTAGGTLGVYISGETAEGSFNKGTNPGDENWSAAAGLKLTSAELSADNFTVSDPIGLFYESFQLTGAGKNKITSLFDYEAETVPFTPQSNDKFFLVPKYVFSAHEELLTAGGYSTYAQRLNDFSMFCPRLSVISGETIDHKLLPNARVRRSTQTTGGDWAYTSHSASAFVGSATGDLTSFVSIETPAGFLAAIIKQGENFYYVWS